MTKETKEPTGKCKICGTKLKTSWGGVSDDGDKLYVLRDRIGRLHLLEAGDKLCEGCYGTSTWYKRMD